MRAVAELNTLEDIPGLLASGPIRLTSQSPHLGGLKLKDIRRALAPRGRVRFSCTPKSLFADVDPGAPEEPLIALDMIARSDARGLHRAIASTLSEVDYINISIDGRSDIETRQMAEAFADDVQVFQAADAEMSENDWTADRINFAGARNFGRARVPLPWTLVLDTDECLIESIDLRAVIKRHPEVYAFAPRVVVLPSGQSLYDYQRLAPTRLRWQRASHNELNFERGLPAMELPDTLIVHSQDLKQAQESARRNKQRDAGIEGIAGDAAKGDLHALYHLAIHRIDAGHEEGYALAQDFRLRAEVGGPLADERVWIALCAAGLAYQADDFVKAKMWAVRALLDGPRAEAFCLLGDIAEDEGDLITARLWYEFACLTPPRGQIQLTTALQLRKSRLAGIKHALAAA